MNSFQKLSNSDLSQLEEMIQSFTCSLNIDETLAMSLERLMTYMNTEAASIFLLDDKDEKLICQASAGPVDLQGLKLEKDAGIVGKAVAESAIQLIRDVADSDSFYGAVDTQTGFKTRSILCAPLTIQNSTIGAIELLNRIPTLENPDGLFEETDTYLLSILASCAALAIHNARLAEELVNTRALQKELEIARTIQESFLPVFEDKHPIVGINLAAREVSGDFFDYLMLPSGKYVFNIGDVSGKGLNAALLMSKASSLFHCLSKTMDSPARILSMINDELYEHATRGMFITMIGGVYDPETRQVTLANAGHPPPIQRSYSGDFKLYETSGLPLGILPDQSYEEYSFLLAESNLYLYTDGLSEGLTRNKKTENELESLKAMIDRFNSEPRQHRLNLFANEVFMRDSSFDDLTILLVEDGTQKDAG